MFDQVKEDIDRGRAGENYGFSTGSKKLDSIINGVVPRTYYLVGGNLGTGKTAFVDHCFVLNPYRQFLLNPERLRFKVFYYSLEINAKRKMVKWVSNFLFHDHGMIVDVNTILSVNKNKLTDDVYTKIMTYNKYVDDMMEHIHFIDERTNPTGIYADTKKYAESPNVGKIEIEEKNIKGRIIKKYKYVPVDKNELVLIIVDHVGLISREKDLATKKDRIDKVSEYVINARNRYGYSCVLISQFNRDLKDIDRQRFKELTPQIEDFKDSGNTQEDADIVMTLFNPARYNMAEYSGMNIARLSGRYRSVSVLKNRDGADMIKMHSNFLGEAGYYRDFPDPILEHNLAEAKNYTKFT